MKFPLSILTLFLLFYTISCSSDEATTSEVEETTNSTLYFPPLDSSDTWETTSLATINWNETELENLLEYLEEKNTKSFIILYNGKIVVEEYMNEHNASSNWYWASAGKTLTSTVSGIAQDEGLLNLDNKVSDYLGTWTSASTEQEDLITCRNLLQMDSGLDDTTGDDVSASNLNYLADAGTRWAYHNVYVKMQDVIATASNQTWSEYFNSSLKEKIGMSGAWISLDDLNVYWSNTRSMARFGLLIAANGNWDGTQIVSENFLTEATNTSQDSNEAYGYLWWLNGKSTYHLPSTQYEFTGSLIPNAPDDMYAALGKNDQKIYIIPSKDLVIVRMGEAADSSNFALSDFDNDLWEKINAVID